MSFKEDERRNSKHIYRELIMLNLLIIIFASPHLFLWIQFNL